MSWNTRHDPPYVFKAESGKEAGLHGSTLLERKKDPFGNEYWGEPGYNGPREGVPPSEAETILHQILGASREAALLVKGAQEKSREVWKAAKDADVAKIEVSAKALSDIWLSCCFALEKLSGQKQRWSACGLLDPPAATDEPVVG